jgi:hypothetical protein
MTDGGFECAAAVSILLAPVILSEAADSRRESAAQSKDPSQFISHSGRVKGDSDVFHRPTVTSNLVPASESRSRPKRTYSGRPHRAVPKSLCSLDFDP